MWRFLKKRSFQGCNYTFLFYFCVFNETNNEKTSPNICKVNLISCKTVSLRKRIFSKKQRQKEDQSKDYKTPNDEKVRKSSAENIEPSVPERYWQWVWHSFISFQVIVFVTHLFLTSFFCITRKTDFFAEFKLHEDVNDSLFC